MVILYHHYVANSLSLQHTKLVVVSWVFFPPFFFPTLLLFSMSFQIDTNHSGIYLGKASPRWSCGKKLTLCVNSHEFEYHQGQFYSMEGGRPKLVEGAEMWFHWPNSIIVHELQEHFSEHVQFKCHEQYTNAVSTVGVMRMRIFVNVCHICCGYCCADRYDVICSFCSTAGLV